MAQQDVLHILCFLITTSTLVSYSSCSQYNDAYDEYGLDTEKICHPLSKKQTHSISNNAAIIVPRRKFEGWFVHPVHCKFVFKTAKGDGLFGAIQKMSFRMNGSECVDYVQFKRKDNQKSEKFCGYLDRSKETKAEIPVDPDNFPQEKPLPVAVYAEYDPITNKGGAELETEIYISNKRLNEGEYLDLSIVYTPYKSCQDVDSEKYAKIGWKACIRHDFFCDGFYNCDPLVCLDEEDCSMLNDGVGTKVTVGAVTTMILCFIIFILCLRICKKSEKCYVMSVYDENQGSTIPGQLPEDPERSVNRPVQTAPMLEVAVSPSVMDKDLPPPYDSLFPGHSNSGTK